MPVYIFNCPACGKSFEKFFPMSRSTVRPKCECGAKTKRDLGAELCSTRRASPGCWPMTSFACNCNPEQIPEFRAFDAKHDVPTEYARDGDPIFTSRAHRKKYCEAHGLFDRSGGYSDAQPHAKREDDHVETFQESR